MRSMVEEVRGESLGAATPVGSEPVVPASAYPLMELNVLGVRFPLLHHPIAEEPASKVNHIAMSSSLGPTC
ncbi:hypothetical protein KRR38_33645 [Novosphingobium sp. G106]|uniref:hypothetical protein n=1 Tax=Novosphingobium sp. G106 TaxID=2849500 RepID=UPI001C2CE5A8|nr:hypothetical protein [Novosphingobium sp. G106]MBV1692178.1 hypothetical protein [Novosphingobium sp. G106]MBV1692449.1 hypothetical protein [Novosphingobium sp. G106]